MSEGDKPITSRDLSSKLQTIWKAFGQWRLISLSRGFFEFQFTNPEDKMKPGQLVPIICDQGCSTSQSGNLIMKKRVFGHCDRVLINIDLPKRIFDEVMVERERFAFYVYILYERLPEFCSNLLHHRTLSFSLQRVARIKQGV